MSWQWTVPDDHPAFAGHFPGRPIVPGVVLLDRVVAGIAAALGRPEAGCTVAQAKFLSPVGPGETLRFTWRETAGGGVGFEIGCGERPVASGMLKWP
jgi:3-hydroxymyristoyl/3-hydroxydecanoyl-(acyl carrier protein) dehydratase